jgi:hypothetical protein
VRRRFGWLGYAGFAAAAAAGWAVMSLAGSDPLRRLKAPLPTASAHDHEAETDETHLHAVREVEAPRTVLEVEEAAAKTQARMEQRLEALPPDVRVLAEARRYASGYPIAEGTEPALRQAIDEVLERTKQEYDDSMQLVTSTRTAVLDRRVAEGRYQKIEKGSGVGPPQRHGAIVNGIRILPDGTAIHLVVEPGEAPELEEAITLLFQVQKERAHAVAAVISRAHAVPATAPVPAPRGDHR